MSRNPIFRVTNDDDPGDYDYPMAATWAQVEEGLRADGDALARVREARVGERVTVGGGAAVQFTITRIR